MCCLYGSVIIYLVSKIELQVAASSLCFRENNKDGKNRSLIKGQEEAEVCKMFPAHFLQISSVDSQSALL